MGPLHVQAGGRRRRPNLALCLLCCVCFSYSVRSQESGWEECLRNDLFCVGWDVKPQLSQWITVLVSWRNSTMSGRKSTYLCHLLSKVVYRNSWRNNIKVQLANEVYLEMVVNWCLRVCVDGEGHGSWWSYHQQGCGWFLTGARVCVDGEGYGSWWSYHQQRCGDICRVRSSASRSSRCGSRCSAGSGSPSDAGCSVWGHTSYQHSSGESLCPCGCDAWICNFSGGVLCNLGDLVWIRLLPHVPESRITSWSLCSFPYIVIILVCKFAYSLHWSVFWSKLLLCCSTKGTLNSN